MYFLLIQDRPPSLFLHDTTKLRLLLTTLFVQPYHETSSIYMCSITVCWEHNSPSSISLSWPSPLFQLIGYSSLSLPLPASGSNNPANRSNQYHGSKPRHVARKFSQKLRLCDMPMRDQHSVKSSMLPKSMPLKLQTLENQQFPPLPHPFQVNDVHYRVRNRFMRPWEHLNQCILYHRH